MLVAACSERHSLGLFWTCVMYSIGSVLSLFAFMREGKPINVLVGLANTRVALRGDALILC